MPVFGSAEMPAAQWGRYPAAPLWDRPGHTIIKTPCTDFWRLPRKVQDAIQHYCTREYTDGMTCWVEVANYRLPELLALMPAPLGAGAIEGKR